MESKLFFQPGVELHTLHSQVLNQDLQIYIKLPWHYGESDKVYPVLYSLDANRAFPLYSTMSLVYETPVFNPKEEIIIAGIGYQVDADRIRGLSEWAAWRTRDLTPVQKSETNQYWEETLSKMLGGERLDVQTGGAALFLRVLREEIIPFVENTYRVSLTDRGLAGYSYGGLFTLYVLFHAPELFSRYHAGSPSMWECLYMYEKDYAATHTDLPAKLLMTIGVQETEELESVQRIADRLRSRAYPGLELKIHVFDGEGHVSGMAASVSRALQVLYYHE